MIRRRFLRGALSAVIVAAVFSAGRTPAHAHAADGNTFPHYYKFRTVLNMYWNSNPNGWWHTIPGIADRVVDGMVSWNTVPGTNNMHLAAAGDRAGMSETACNGSNINGLFWTAIDGAGNKLGITTFCYFASDPVRLTSVTILFDGQEPNWYVGNGAAPANTNDLWSVASHELGHAQGFFLGGSTWKHWEEPYPPGLDATLCPGSSTYRHTMCSVIEQGTTYMRSPAQHDYETFNARYP